MSTFDRFDDPIGIYTCIDSGLGERLYQYYNGELAGAEALETEAHLLICVACRSKVNLLDSINAALKQELDATENTPKFRSVGSGNPF